MSEATEALESDLNLLTQTNFRDTISISYLNSRDEMKQLFGRAAKGWTVVDSSKIFLVCNQETRPYHKHEIMHVLTAKYFGVSDMTSFWMNEGMSVCAEKLCYEYS